MGSPMQNNALRLTPLTFNFPHLAQCALREEIELLPKPGLVDRESNGAHRDMCHSLFIKSIEAISPWFESFYIMGLNYPELDSSAFLASLRPIGLACEQAMFEATGGVNTHKGGIFSLGLLCSAAGQLTAQNQIVTVESICNKVSQICNGMVRRELAQGVAKTAGARIYKKYGFPGARGEAESGFHLVRTKVLPFWQVNIDKDKALLFCLLTLMAHNCDTNLISRGGIEGLTFVQQYARRLLLTDWNFDDLRLMDAEMIRRNLSPGGSADLLAVSFFLQSIESTQPSNYMDSIR